MCLLHFLLQLYRILTSSGYDAKDFSSVFQFLQEENK